MSAETTTDVDNPSKYTCFQLTVDGGVAHVRMIRPQQHNSMNALFWKELPLVIDEVESDSAVRVLVLSADGATFCSGMDLAVFANQSLLSTDTPAERLRLRRLVLHLQSVINRIGNCRVPVLAAIQGGCIGAGLDLACACDLRYATNAAYFVIHEINLGMMADLGTLQRLPHLIPAGLATELALTGDKLPAQRAQSAGLLAEVLADETALLARVMAVAKRIAQRSPVAVAASREALRFAQTHSLEDALEAAATWQAAIFSGTDVMKAVGAQRSGATADFADVDASAFDL